MNLEVPEGFICPITQTIMVDPVVLSDTGHSFDREAIQRWLQDHDTNPNTGIQLQTPYNLVPNYALRASIEQFVVESRGRIVPFRHLVVHEQVARGETKIAYRGECRGIGSVVVLKFFTNADPFATISSEALILVRLGLHRRLVRLFGRVHINEDGQPTAGQPNALVMEYASEGSLLSILHMMHDHGGGQVLSLHHLLVILTQVAEGMEAVHRNNILHRDLAARNIMVFKLDAQGDPARIKVKVGDYGLSTILGTNSYHRSTAQNLVPVRHMAPEAIRRRYWSKATDVWAFGVFLWELFTYGEFPYSTIISDNEVAAGVAEGTLLLPKPNHCPDSVWELAMRCMSQNPSNRPNFEDIQVELERLKLTVRLKWFHF